MINHFLLFLVKDETNKLLPTTPSLMMKMINYSLLFLVKDENDKLLPTIPSLKIKS